MKKDRKIKRIKTKIKFKNVNNFKNKFNGKRK